MMNKPILRIVRLIRSPGKVEAFEDPRSKTRREKKEAMAWTMAKKRANVSAQAGLGRSVYEIVQIISAKNMEIHQQSQQFGQQQQKIFNTGVMLHQDCRCCLPHVVERRNKWKTSINLTDEQLIRWAIFTTSKSHPQSKLFQAFRVHDGSILAYIGVIIVCFAIFGGFIRHTLTTLPTWNSCTTVLFWLSIGMIFLLFVLIFLKLGQYNCFGKTLKPKNDVETVCPDETTSQSIPIEEDAVQATVFPKALDINDDDQRKHQLHSIQNLLENATLWLSVMLIEYYAIYLILLQNYWDTDSLKDSNIPGDHLLPEGVLAAGFFLPVCLYFVFNHVTIRSVLLLLLTVFIATLVLTIQYGLYNSLTKLCLAFTMSMFISLEYHRQCWGHFLVSVRLQETMTQNLRLAEEVKASELRHMIGNVAHDLKTPLSAFISGIDVIRSVTQDLQHDVAVYQMSPPCQYLILDKVREKAGNILEMTENVTNMNTFMIMTINRCIDYNKTLFGLKLVAKIESVLIKDCVDFVLKCVQSTISTTCRVCCKYDCVSLCDGNMVIQTDKQWLIENLLCLLSNAVKYSRIDSVIRLNVDIVDNDDILCSNRDTETMPSLQYMRFTVIDSGPGIAKEVVPDLFHEPTQTARLTGGTGLGLYSLAQRVHTLDGKYGVSNMYDDSSVSNEKPVIGCAIWFALPFHCVSVSLNQHNHSVIVDVTDVSVHDVPTTVMREEDHNTLSDTVIDPIALTAKYRKVLVADDSSIILKMTSLSLYKQGYEVTTAVNGLNAVELCQQTHFDVIIMDFQMPVMDGIEAIKAIRKQEQQRLIADPLRNAAIVIGFSAKSDDEQIQTAYQQGMDYFLPKPFLIKSFHECLFNASLSHV